MKPIKIQLGPYLYTIPPEGYTSTLLFGCIIDVSSQSDSDNYVLLGSPFLRSFYYFQDYENNQISLAINSAVNWSPTIRKATLKW